MQDKRVVLIVRNHFENDSRVLKEALSLKNAGYIVKVIALGRDDLKAIDVVEGIDVERISPTNFICKKGFLFKLHNYFSFFKQFVKRYKSNDIFHCNDLDTLPIGFAIKSFYNKNCKVVYDAHEYATEQKGMSGLRKQLSRFVERSIIKKADIVFTVSDSIANEYVRLYGIVKPKIVLNTPHLIDLEKSNYFKDKFKLSDDSMVFLYQGSLSMGRGVERLIKIFSNTADSKILVFMGYGPLTDIVKKASQNNDNIYYHEAVSPVDLLTYTCSADIGIAYVEDCCLNHTYCLPNKLFEYIMANIPVLVPDLCEMRKFVTENNAGFVMDGRTNVEISKCINGITKESLEKVSKNLHKVRTVYNWTNQEKVLINGYKSL